jgi:hypothetical protein
VCSSDLFIKDFGTAFFRAGNEACNSNFFTLILTTHLQSAQKISRAWTVAGLSPSIPLNPGGHASLLTRKPDTGQCIDIITQHLKYYREPSFELANEFYPFTQKAIETIIEECDYHPRRFLSRCREIIKRGVSENVKEIGPEFVKTVPEVEEEEAPGIEEL